MKLFARTITNSAQRLQQAGVHAALLVLPAALMLASCSQSPMVVDKKDMVSTQQTTVPKNFVVYPDDRPSIPDGAMVWKAQNCAQCHGDDGGKDPVAKLNDPRAMARHKPVETYKFLAFGDEKSHHPALLQQRSVRDVWNLVFYSRSLATPALTDKDLEAILPVFGANCAVCHGTKGDGDGPLARNLEPMPANFQTFRRFYDRDDDTLFDHIANGIKWEGMPNFLGKEDRKKNVKFDHAYIHKLVQYIRNFHVSNQPTIVAAQPATGGATSPTGAESSSTTTGTATGQGTEAGKSTTTTETPTQTDQPDVKSNTGSTTGATPGGGAGGQ